MLVDLKRQVDLRQLGEELARRRMSKRERRDAVLTALERLAMQSQESLRPFLEGERRAGRVRSWTGFAVVNRLLVEATPEGIAALARRPEVAAVVPETELPAPVLAAESQAGPPEKTSWALAAIGAPAAWQRGLDGTGVIVGIIDSGATAVHEQLAAGFRGGESSWLDPRGRSPEPRDTLIGHGTGVLSVAVGRNAAGVTLGVAPGAKWIACAALPEGRYNNVLATQCADWMLRVARPDVLILPWLLPTGGCDRSLQPLVDGWRAAGILPVFAAGNHGPAPGTDRSPANYDDLYPGGRTALAIGGLGRDGALWPGTSRGPSACGGGEIPLLSAPAVDLVAAFPITRSSYLRAEGTSFAAGLAAGAAALLLQHRPEAAITEIEDALRGSRSLDVPAALDRLDASSKGKSPAPAPAPAGTPDRWCGR